MLLKVQRPRRLLLKSGPDGAGKFAPRSEVSPEGMQHQHAFEFSARRAACRSGQYGGQDQQTDAETRGHNWPAWVDRLDRDASAHPPTPAVSDVRAAAFQHNSSANCTAVDGLIQPGTTGSAARIDLAIGINYLRAGGRGIIRPGRDRSADNSAADNRATRRSASDARITHWRQGAADTCLGLRDKPAIDSTLVAPEQSSGKRGGGCDEQDSFAR